LPPSLLFLTDSSFSVHRSTSGELEAANQKFNKVKQELDAMYAEMSAVM
jgi:hypothetical protein